MRTIIDYIRSCFCEHDWHVEDIEAEVEYSDKTYPYDNMKRSGVKVYMRCNTCGYNKNHWKV